MEEAAASLGAGGFTIFRRIIFPNLLPGLAAGVALAFARALGEYGSVLLFAGGLPNTQVSSIFISQQIETGNETGAAAVSVVLLSWRWSARPDHADPALGQHATNAPGRRCRRPHRDADERRGLRPRRATTMRSASSTRSRWGLRVLGLGYLALLLLAPLVADLLQDLRTRAGAAVRRDHLARRPARAEAEPADGRDRGAAEHDLRRHLRAAPGPPQLEGQRG